MASTGNMSDTIRQLNQARDLCLADPNALYPQIVPGLAPLINATADLELRRWGADFLAETFASPVLAAEHKQKLSIAILDGLKGFLDKPEEDATVIKNVVQTASSIYQYVFRHIIANPNDVATWQKMAGIKSSILRRMDSAPAGVRICCIKFVQRVIQVQTPGIIADPRRPEQNETSLALVPRDHPVIPPSNLEAEASGLLDRLLSVLQDNSSDALIVTATLNSLATLVRSRASIGFKIVSTILNFNPFRLANGPMTPKDRIMLKSITKTTMSFMTNIIKKTPTHPLAARIQQYVERLRHSLIEALDETSRKRPAPSEPTDGLSDAKRQRVNDSIPSQLPQSQEQYPPLPPGPITFAQLYTLTQDKGTTGFDVNALPLDLVIRLVPPLLASIDKAKFENAINAVRARYLALTTAPPRDALSASNVALGVEPIADEEDEDYEPDFPYEGTEQVMNEMDQSGGDDAMPLQTPEVALGTFSLPPPSALTEQETVEYSKGAVSRVFGTLASLDHVAATRTQKRGFNRLAASNQNRDAWVTVISRLATRASAGLENVPVKPENGMINTLSRNDFSPSDSIRDALYLYVIEDFRRRIDVAIAWLNEEWYNDRIQQQQNSGNETTSHYTKWMLKVLDGILPFLDAKDKLLIRFLSEVPALDQAVLKRVTRLAADPERVPLAVQAVHYLILFRPPVRDMCVDALEDLYKNYDDAKASVAKLLTKWRPQVLEQEQTNGSGTVKAEA